MCVSVSNGVLVLSFKRTFVNFHYQAVVVLVTLSFICLPNGTPQRGVCFKSVNHTTWFQKIPQEAYQIRRMGVQKGIIKHDRL